MEFQRMQIKFQNISGGKKKRKKTEREIVTKNEKAIWLARESNNSSNKQMNQEFKKINNNLKKIEESWMDSLPSYRIHLWSVSAAF